VDLCPRRVDDDAHARGEAGAVGVHDLGMRRDTALRGQGETEGNRRSESHVCSLEARSDRRDGRGPKLSRTAGTTPAGTARTRAPARNTASSTCPCGGPSITLRWTAVCLSKLNES